MKSAKLASAEVFLPIPECDLQRKSGNSFPEFHLKKSYWERPGTREHGKQYYRPSPMRPIGLPSLEISRKQPKLMQDVITSEQFARKHYEPLSAATSRVVTSREYVRYALWTPRKVGNTDRGRAVEACRDLYLSLDAGKYAARPKEDQRSSFAERLQGYLSAHKDANPLIPTSDIKPIRRKLRHIVNSRKSIGTRN